MVGFFGINTEPNGDFHGLIVATGLDAFGQTGFESLQLFDSFGQFHRAEFLGDFPQMLLSFGAFCHLVTRY